jgi:hypothetical protein
MKSGLTSILSKLGMTRQKGVKPLDTFIGQAWAGIEGG